MTLSLTVQNPVDSKAKSAKVELPAEIFDAKTNVSLLHQVVVAQLAAARQGTASTKTRGEVRGGGKKPYRQKGTGRARQGSTRAPQFVGGGVVHGPQPRSYEQRTPKKMKAAALRGALSDRARNDRVHVVSALVSGETPSTKDAAIALASVSERRNVLLVVERTDEVNWLSARNLTGVHILEPGQLNTYDVLCSDDVVFTKSALDAFVAGPVAGKSAKGAASSTEVEVEDVDVDVDTADAVDVTKKPEPVAAVEVAEVDDEAADTNIDSDTDAVDFGPDSHAPLADADEAPEGFPVKGNADSMLYHVPGSSFYKRTVAEVWFTDADAAEAAGFSLPPSQRAKKDGDA